MRILFTWLLFATFAYGQVPAPIPPIPKPGEDDTVVIGVESANPATWKIVNYTPGKVKTLSSGNSKAIRWELIDDKDSDLVASATDPKKPKISTTATFTSPIKSDGIRILAYGTVVGEPARILMVADGVQPNPNPVPPTPVPPVPPTPTPVVGKVAKFVVVEDTSKADIFRGNILGSPSVAAYYKAAKLHHRLIDINATDNADPEAAAFIKAATGKPLPYLWTFDATKALLSEGNAPTTSDAFLLAIGSEPVKRSMGNNPAPKKYAWKQFGSPQQPTVPIYPRSQWKEVNYANFLPPVYDQDGIGQCNASATGSLVETARNIAGLQYVHLSAGDLYGQINGGRDQGSTLEDGLYAAMNNGIATVNSVPYLWDRKKHNVTDERKSYRVLEAYECPTFDAVASAELQGFVCVVGLMWYDGDNVDRDGWIPAVGRGGSGGHALLAYGLTQRNGVWGLRIRNSWSDTWGIGGNCIIPESRFGQAIGGFWAVRAVVQTPTDFPVMPKLTARKLDPFTEYALAH